MSLSVSDDKNADDAAETPKAEEKEEEEVSYCSPAADRGTSNSFSDSVMAALAGADSPALATDKQVGASALVEEKSVRISAHGSTTTTTASSSSCVHAASAYIPASNVQNSRSDGGVTEGRRVYSAPSRAHLTCLVRAEDSAAGIGGASGHSCSDINLAVVEVSRQAGPTQPA